MTLTIWAGVLVSAGLAVLLVLLLHRFLRRRQTRDLPMDGMEGHDFEYYCADVLRRAGFEEVEVTRGSGDFGADILAQRDGITYAVQCKCYDGAVGVHAVQEVYAGKDYYDRMVGAVMTNRTFTEPAQRCARKLHVLLWDRQTIEEMEQG